MCDYTAHLHIGRQGTLQILKWPNLIVGSDL